MPLIPARLEFAADGTPWSEEFGDVYHSAAGGPAQARHVFLAGNRLPERWAGRERFSSLETGFGLGLNFLATWQAWRRDPARCGRLHFVSVEKHPFTLSSLRVLHSRYPEFENEAAQLHACWPMLVPGAHRLELDAGRVVLTLLFSDIKLLRELRLAADAIYLDGFSPARNPDMWSHALLRAVSRLAGPGATAATWSVAAPVRAALESAGFAVEKSAGFGSKREMLLARYIRKANPVSTPRRNALVIGAGLAGAAICERRCARRARFACRVCAVGDARRGGRARRRAGGGSGFVVSRGGVDPAAVAGQRAARSSRDEARTYFRQGNTFD